MGKKEKTLDYLYKCYRRGLPITDEELLELSKNGYDVNYTEKPQVKKVNTKPPKRKIGSGKDGYNFSIKRDYTVLSEDEIMRNGNNNIDIIEVDKPMEFYPEPIIVEEEDLYKDENVIRYGFDVISKKDWMPESIIYHTKEFYDWIDSINNGFQNRIEYQPFNRYIQQCEDWLAKGYDYSNYSGYDQIEFVVDEMTRIETNTLYFANKYAFLQEASEATGMLKYIADKYYVHHQILFYLLDCGYSMIFGKPRQIGSTSAFGIGAVAKTLTRTNHFLKFITEDKETGLEIFNDKILFVYNQLPGWMKAGEPLNYRENLFKISHSGSSKGKAGGREKSSKIQIVAPSKTAINGGSPQLVYVDEIGSIPILSEMLNEGRPTLFRMNKVTGLLEQRRTLIAWGCVCAGTKVWTNNGDLVNVEDLKQEDGIIGYNGNSAAINNITWMQPPVEKPCYRITTATTVLECSNDHPILASSGYKYLKENNKRIARKKVDFTTAESLEKGMQIAMIDEVPFWGDKEMKNPRLIGWMIGDGNYGTTKNAPRRQPRFYNCDEEINKYFDENLDTTVYLERDTKDGRIYKERNIRGLANDLREVGIYGQSKSKKTLPSDIFKYRKEDVCELIGGLFDTDGCVHKRGIIDIDSSSSVMLNELKHLFYKLGIHSTVVLIKARIAENRKDKNDYYRLTIGDKVSIVRFKNNIKLVIKYKQNLLNSIVEELEKKDVIKKSRSRATGLEGIRLDTIKSIEYIGYKPIYNLTAGDNNTYIANGIITHNTGTSEKGGAAYEKEWNRVVGLWEQREASVGIVPLFFDWSVRLNEKQYYEEKKFYYGARAQKDNIDIETSKIQFHQHYPSNPADMFVPTGKTLISRETIEKNLTKIRNKISNDPNDIENKVLMTYGFFEPIYDISKPQSENSDVPYAISGANFIQTDAYDERVTTTILVPPNKAWKYRFYAGTDPITTDTGASRMATTIWDEQLHTVAAVTDCKRNNDPNYSFMQSMLLTIYYGEGKEAVPEIVERNIGLAYRNYRENKGFLNSLLINAQVDPYFQSGQPYDIGVDNRGVRNTYIINRLGEVMNMFGDNIYHDTVFRQLATFHCTTTKSGNTLWSSIDKRYYNDDVLFGLAYAYICAISVGRKPESIEEAEKKEYKVKYRIVLDKNYNLKRVPITSIKYGS